MTENTMIQLSGSEGKEKWHMACESLWRDVFGDCEEFVKYYIESTWRENQVLILPETERSIASMLHMNPYTLCVRDERLKLHYIVGVCTRKELRGRGYMGFLLKRALRILKSQGEPFTYLMPAAVDIYTPYQFVPVGFTKKTVRQVSINQAELQAAEDTEENLGEESLRLIPYGKLSRQKQEKMSRFATDNREGIFVLPSVDYLLGLERQMTAYDGELLTVWQEEDPVGMAAYLYVADDEPPAEVVQLVFRKGKEKSICEQLHRHLCARFSLGEIQIQYDAVPDITERHEHRMGAGDSVAGRQSCISMFRCLDPIWFLQRLTRPVGWKRECVVEIKDAILQENNGAYQICFVEGQKKNHVRQSDARAEYCLNVEMLVQYWLKSTPVYTPELI